MISRLNSRNIMASRKNFMEKGKRADTVGSNVHSYELDFSTYTFTWGSQKAIVTSNEASRAVVSSATTRLIIFSEYIETN